MKTKQKILPLGTYDCIVKEAKVRKVRNKPIYKLTLEYEIQEPTELKGKTLKSTTLLKKEEGEK